MAGSSAAYVYNVTDVGTEGARMNTLDGMVAIITGAARGQGEAEARLLTEHGARVVLTDIRTEQGEAVAADIGPAARFVAHDILVNNAAITPPLRRMGDPMEIARAVLFLVSPAASFATGAELAIDGGMSI